MSADAFSNVTELATHRRRHDRLSTISFVFAGVHYGTISISAPYVRGKPIALYIVPRDGGGDESGFSGPLDCLVTDDAALAADLDVAR